LERAGPSAALAHINNSPSRAAFDQTRQRRHATSTNVSSDSGRKHQIATHKYGNADDLSVDARDTSNDTYILGNGKMDAATIDATTLDTIKLGNGNGDTVSAADTASGTSNDTITLGNGANDSVRLFVGNFDTISMGNGAGDSVNVSFEASSSKIILGNGDGDSVYALEIRGGNTIIVGNGTGDTVTLYARQGPGGNDTVVTGTGLDAVNILGPSHSPDTFAFALGTGGSAVSQTTVTGANPGDHIAVGNSKGLVLNNAGLGDSLLVQKGTIAGLATVNDFINYLTSHGGLTKGDTYTADNGVNTFDTFVVTDTQGGQVGGIEIVGVYENNTLAGHILNTGRVASRSGPET
jgi:hypothetical protein